jgi:hypothetical protein
MKEKKLFIYRIADYLSVTNADLKVFSSQNLWRIKQFYKWYKDNEKHSTLLREIN